ncbi:MAG: SGNH/GDSL hydrolase family protein [Planctomycetota bacterium]
MASALPPPIDPTRATPMTADEMPWKDSEPYLWYDAEGLTLAGKGWPTESKRYQRFPSRAEGKIPPGPWRLSLACAGLSLRFHSDAPFFFIRTVDFDGRPNIAQISHNSPSLYVRRHGRWQWLGLDHPAVEGSAVHKLVNGAMPRGLREYLLYLPLGRGMTKLELAIPADCKLIPALPRTEKPIVFYGTSINHGGNASRPGTNHVARVERHFDYPTINLGLSGNGRMEPEVVDLVNEIDARLFVVDCLPNMQAPEVRERFAPCIQQLRAGHPDVPIVVVDNVIYQDGFLVTDRYERYTKSNAAQQEEFAKLVAAGVPNLHYVHARELFTDEVEATVDGTHPNDLGFKLMAEALIKAIAPFMPGAEGPAR